MAELRALEEIQAICIFGSAARGEQAADSDVDVLVVVPEKTDVPKVRQRVRGMRARSQTQMRLLTSRGLEKEFSKKTVFAAHLAREGQVIVDRDGGVTRLLERHPKNAPVNETAQNLFSRLQAYNDLAWCGGYYLFCLSDLYAWGRSGAMLALARAGEFEFDRERVFDRLTAVHGDLRAPAATIRRLRPFWEVVNRESDSPLPFPAVGSDKETVEARDACREILAKSL